MRGVLSMFIYAVRDGFVRPWINGMLDGLWGLKRVLRDREVISKQTMAMIRHCNKRKIGAMYILKTRIFNRGARL